MFFPYPNLIAVQVLQGHSPFKQLVKRYVYASCLVANKYFMLKPSFALEFYMLKPIRLTCSLGPSCHFVALCLSHKFFTSHRFKNDLIVAVGKGEPAQCS